MSVPGMEGCVASDATTDAGSLNNQHWPRLAGIGANRSLRNTGAVRLPRPDRGKTTLSAKKVDPRSQLQCNAIQEGQLNGKIKPEQVFGSVSYRRSPA